MFLDPAIYTHIQYLVALCCSPLHHFEGGNEADSDHESAKWVPIETRILTVHSHSSARDVKCETQGSLS